MYKVIIVDDEDTIVTGLSQLLPWQKFGCEISATANNGESALSLIRELKPDILFTDIRMPGMDGLSLIAAFRSEFPEMQITILSGYPEFEYAQRALHLGVANYLLKPSRIDELESALMRMTEILNKRRDRAVAAEDEEGISAAENDETAAASSESGENASNFITRNALRYIEEHYSERLTLPNVAQQVFVSQWHLSKLISRYTGQSFNGLLNRVRIDRAKELLSNPALKIWEISEMVGFSDVTHFSRIFKKIEGKSANEYRNHRTEPV
ncbi:MAG: response regulator [Spirochaetaceae bacterium]|jgi:YesN/AraC family two-component response regulator|nr:response regulator [Spirochaetaceae bacterium]